VELLTMAQVANIIIDQGSTYNTIFVINTLTTPTLPFNSITNPYIPLSFSGYTAELQVRKDFNTTTSALLTLTDTSGITLGSNGTITVNITANQTSSIPFSDTKLCAYYDLKLTNSSGSTRIVQGTFTINRSISR
jgi:hypothetical protein